MSRNGRNAISPVYRHFLLFLLFLDTFSLILDTKVSRNGNDGKSVTYAGPEQPFRCLDSTGTNHNDILGTQVCSDGELSYTSCIELHRVASRFVSFQFDTTAVVIQSDPVVRFPNSLGCELTEQRVYTRGTGNLTRKRFIEKKRKTNRQMSVLGR